jgi:hypothetical protein
MHVVSPSKIKSIVHFSFPGEDDDDDDDAAGRTEDTGCDYIVALESDNTLEIISAEDGQLVNVLSPPPAAPPHCGYSCSSTLTSLQLQVVSPELCREQLRSASTRVSSSQSAQTSTTSAASSVRR